MVGARGFEPPTSCAPCKCATRLRYAPNQSLLIEMTTGNYIHKQTAKCSGTDLRKSVWNKTIQPEHREVLDYALRMQLIGRLNVRKQEFLPLMCLFDKRLVRFA